MSDYILTITCDDRTGIVAAVSTFLSERSCFVKEAAQYGDPDTNRFFLRLVFTIQDQALSLRQIEKDFDPVGQNYRMTWNFYDTDEKPRVMLMVSRFGHCLNDLLYRWRQGFLPIEITSIVSNHRDFEEIASWHKLPYYYLPVTKENKPQQEKALFSLIETQEVDLVVLARYMQVLSDELCQKLKGRAINIHHSFLPSFKGAKPYHQAHARGVKLIGATAHFVTSDLDEGPIIDQDVERVDHSFSPDDMIAQGRDIESRVLARAVKYFAEKRILLNGTKTVVFK